MYNYAKNSLIKGITYMKPRIFISSTFYDLKYIREDLANFVRSYGYEPILFEDGDIGYTPGRTLDSSCYESMRNSDMVILIIGGEYGSAASGEKKDEFKEYMSVTRNEFRTAVESGIPIFVMIDKKVMAEYGVYEANYKSIEKGNMEMTFPTTKNINVFRFIREIKGIVTLPIQEFEQSSDIKGFISKQWADMFKNYLSSLRNEKENRKIEGSVNEMKTLIQKMDIMLDSVGKNVLSKENPQEYADVLNRQEILGFCDALIEGFRWDKDRVGQSLDERKEFITKLLECILELSQKNILNNSLIATDNEKFEEFLEVFYKHGLKSPAAIFSIQRIEEKVGLLSETRNKNAIIDIMMNDEYFNKLIEF